VRLRRAIHYALILVRRSVPLSISNFSTAIVFPFAFGTGKRVLGDSIAGQQALYWSCIVALSIASQSYASRALVRDDARSTGRAALRSWLPPAIALCLVAVILYVLFTVPIPWLPRTGAAREAMVPSLLVSGIAPILTDPLCFYFSGQKHNRLLAAGSAICSAIVAGFLVLFPAEVVRHFGVFGPSAVVGVLRLAFLIDAPARWPGRAAMVLLLAAYGVALRA
jgi:hypothetical protein